MNIRSHLFAGRFYVLFVVYPDDPGNYINMAGSDDRESLEAAAREAVSNGARSAHVVRMLYTVEP